MSVTSVLKGKRRVNYLGFLIQQLFFSKRSAASPQAGADAAGQQLAAELMLALTAQRGMLHFLLDWVDLALHVSAAARSEEKKSGVHEGRLGRIGLIFFQKVLSEMVQSAVSCAFFSG